MLIASPRTAKRLRKLPGQYLAARQGPSAVDPPVVPRAGIALQGAHNTLLRHGYQPARDYSQNDLSRMYQFPGVNLIRLWQMTGPSRAGAGAWFDSSKASAASKGQHKQIPVACLDQHLQQVQQFHAPKVEAAYDPSEPRNQEGEWTDGGGEDRSARAKASYKPSTQAKQLIADRSEMRLARALGLPRTKNNSAFDLNNGQVGIEIKTLIDNQHDKITMHPSSRRRKLKEARKSRLKIYTVGIDVRGSKPVYYWRKGVGSFTLSAMNAVSSLSKLKKAIL